jgi:hypothetical protein
MVADFEELSKGEGERAGQWGRERFIAEHAEGAEGEGALARR